MRTRLFFLSYLLLLLPASCKNELTAADCAGYTTREGCEHRGCEFVSINRAIMDGQVCVAAERRPGCLATGDSVNNVIGVVCRDLPDGGYEFVIFGAARPADGWESCGNDDYGACSGPVTTCEGFTTGSACEAAHCYWAEPVRAAVIDGEGACTGWDPQTTGLCLTPEPYLTYFEGENDFDRYAQEERIFSVEPAQGPRRVLAFTVSRSAYFTSGPAETPDSWRTCNTAASSPCSCP